MCLCVLDETLEKDETTSPKKRGPARVLLCSSWYYATKCGHAQLNTLNLVKFSALGDDFPSDTGICVGIMSLKAAYNFT